MGQVLKLVPKTPKWRLRARGWVTRMRRAAEFIGWVTICSVFVIMWVKGGA